MANKPPLRPKRAAPKPRTGSTRAAPSRPANPPRGNSYQGNPAYRGAKPRRGRHKKTASGGGGGRFGRRRVVLFLLRMMMAGAIIGGITIMYFASQLPDIREIDTIKKQQGITVETADGRVIANYGDVYGSYLPYDQLPKNLVRAVLATEDRRFFQHPGVDFFGIARAAFINLWAGHLVQGGSTITQQVAKNVFLTPERSISRKIQEVLLAFWLEGRFSKQEIMAIYLNRVYLGAGAFGVDAASRRYFNKSARDLDLAESALMAGLLKAPSRYSPAANAERARDRVHQVLVNMVDAGYLTKKEIAPALANFTKSPAHTEQGGDVRYFTDWVVDEIPGLVGQIDSDMVVTTTLDTALQTQALDSLENIISTQGVNKNVSQGALVAMTPEGAVKAMIGGLSYSQSQYNRASQAKRQPGSSFKLFVYLAALEAGYTPQSTVTDAPISLVVGNKSWSPDNFETQEYRGEIPLYEALRYSLNTVSVRLSQQVGLRRVADMAERLGIPNVPAYPSIALGSVEATVLEMTGAYAHLANGGNKVVPYGILRIRTRKGEEIYKRPETANEPVLAKGTTEMMNYMLLDAARRGTGAKAALPGRPTAGKTGTSQDYKDAWFIGFTQQMVTGVWIGNDDNKSMKKVTGGFIPALIWHDFMTHAMAGVKVGAIANSPSNGEGLFPWLFGGEGEKPEGEEGATEPEAIPADAPFGLRNPRPQPEQPVDSDTGVAAEEPTRIAPPAPLGGPEPSAVSAPAALPPPQPLRAEPPQDRPPEVLTPQFWNTLMKDVPLPDKSKVEYTYPDGGRR